MCQQLPTQETCCQCTEICRHRFARLDNNRLFSSCLQCGDVMIVRRNSPRRYCSQKCYWRGVHPEAQRTEAHKMKKRRWTPEMEERWNNAIHGDGAHRLLGLILEGRA
jgi:hypothetical protein